MASIKVAVRVRPFNEREKAMASKCIIRMEENRTSIQSPKKQQFKEFVYDASFWSFDRLHGDYKSQEDVYDCLGAEAVDNAFAGYNTCICAYGQTGSGKSYTMMGAEGAATLGLIPRICRAVLDRARALRDGVVVASRVEVSYLELYNEKIRDLLASGGSKRSLRLHEAAGPGRRVCVDGLSQHRVVGYEEVERLLRTGNGNRATSATGMNESSSRSHAVFTLTLTQVRNSNGMLSEIVSKLSLVDLAGSENAKSTGIHSGARLLESRHINTSLFTLMTVIAKLAAQKTSTTTTTTMTSHVPYRNSKLTHLLKDCLGGNAKTVFIATISPAELNYVETLSTLLYADRAKSIVNRPVINETPGSKLVRELRAEIEHLRSLLESHQKAIGPSRDENGNSSRELDREEAAALKLRLAECEREAAAHADQIGALTRELLLRDRQIEQLQLAVAVSHEHRRRSPRLADFLRLELLSNYSTTVVYLTLKTLSYLAARLQRRFGEELRLLTGPVLSLLVSKLRLAD